MNMKNFLKSASIAALLITSLLVITGCFGGFGPPAGEPGTGTLIVSFGGDGRTILPAARLDKYVLFIEQGGNTITDGIRVLTSGTGLVLPAGSYDLRVYGFVLTEDADPNEVIDEDTEEPPEGWILVAEGTADGITVTAGEVSSAAIALTPADSGTVFNDGKGYFDWDFEELSITALSVKIYNVEGTTQVGSTITVLTGDVELDAGVYSVLMEATAGGKTYKWVEVLYIYAGLTSKYVAALSTNELKPDVYVTPDTGDGYFYLDLNRWTNPGTNAVAGNNSPVTGTLAADKLTVNFNNVNGQRLNIKLSTAQQALLMASKYITITINAEPDADTTKDEAFRFHIGAVGTSGNWNATNTAHEGKFSTIISGPKGTDFGGNKTSLADGFSRLEYFILQHREQGPDGEKETKATTLTIKSIRIDYTEEDGIFFVDLSGGNKALSQGDNVRPPVTGAVFEDGVLKANFVGDQFLNVALTAGQTASLANAATLSITVWGTATPNTQNFRYYLGDPTEASWVGAGPAQGSTDVVVGNLLDASGRTSSLAVSVPANQKYFVLQGRSGTTSTDVALSAIRVAFTNKVWVRPPAATADYEIIDATNALTLTKSVTGNYGNIEIALDGTSNGNSTADAATADSSTITIALPGGQKLGAWDTYTLKIEAYDATNTLISGEVIQFAFVSDTSNFWNNRIGGGFGNTPPDGGFVKKAFTQAELEADTIAGIYMQDKVAFEKLVITEFTLHVAE